jgi:VCBS repeat-containing protein
LVEAGISNADVIDILGLDSTSITDINTFNPFATDVVAADALAFEKVATQIFTTVNTIAEAINEAASDDIDADAAFALAIAEVASKVETEVQLRAANVVAQAEADALQVEADALQVIVDAGGDDAAQAQTDLTAKNTAVTAKLATKETEVDLDLTSATVIEAIADATILEVDTRIKAVKAAEEAALQAQADALKADADALQVIVDAGGDDAAQAQTDLTAKDAEVTTKKAEVTAKNVEATADVIGDGVSALAEAVSKAVANVNALIEEVTAFDATAKDLLNVGAEKLATQAREAVTGKTAANLTLAAETVVTLSEDETVSFTVTGTDSNSSVSAIFYGDLTFDTSTDKWTYTPHSGHADDLADMQVYDDAFVITESDGVTEHTVTVALVGKNDTPTLDQSTTATGSITEDAETSTATGTIVATDIDTGDTLTYSITSPTGTYGSLVLDDTTTGAWTYELSNLNVQTSALTAGEVVTDTIAVTVTDVAGESISQNVVITITGANDAPVITSSATVSTPENGTAATTITTTDAESDAITYSIVSGTDAALFSIDSSTGVLTFVTAPDYELVSPVADDNTYTLTVNAYDGTVNVTQDVTVTVTNVEGSPVFSSAETITVNENQTTVITLTATDDENDSIAFTIVSGDDSGSFSLTTGGALTFQTAPNYEVKSSYSVTLRATEVGTEALNSADQTLVVTIADINDAPTVSSAIADASTNEDAAYSYDASANFADADSGDEAIYTMSGNPAWLTITSAGVLSGTPTNDDVTTIATDITVTRTDTASASVSDTFALTVANTNDAPTISGDTTGAVTADVKSVTGDLPGADVDTGDTLTYSVATELGTYGSLSVNSSGTWTYLLADTDADTVALLASNSVATDTFSVIVTDAAGDTASETVTVTVGNRAPTLTTISEITGEDEDNATTITYDMLIAAADEADADGDTISFRVEVVSTGSLTKDDTAVTAGTTTIASGESLVWTPAADANGTLNAFTVKAYDGTSYSSTAVQVQVSVAAVNDAPTTGDQTITLNEDTIYTFSASDFTFADVDSGAALASIQLTNFTNPGGGFGIFVDANDDDLYDVGEEVTGSSVINITDIDAGNLKAGASTENSNGDGFATVSFTVSDGTASSALSGTNTFNVAAVDDAAVIAGDISGSGDEDNDIPGTLTATDTADGLTDSTYFTISADPANGTATIDAATGAWSYSPTSDYNGVDGFTVTITDDDDHTITQAISLTINAVNDAPVAVADSVTILEVDDTTATVISILDNDTDADVGDSISLFSKTNGSNGSVINKGDGTVSYTPAVNFNGIDTFTYTATDGTNTSEPGTVTVTVTAVNDDPSGSVTIAGTIKTGQTLTASNDLADVDGLGTISYQWSKDGTAVSGATDATLVLDDDDIGSTFTVTASYTDDDGTAESETSSATSAVADIDKAFFFTSEIIEASEITTSSIGDYADTPTENIIKLTLNVDMARVSDDSVDSIITATLDFVVDWSKIEVISYLDGAYQSMYIQEAISVTATNYAGNSVAITTFGGLTYDGSASETQFNEVLISSVDVDTSDVPNLILVDNVDTTPANPFAAGVDHASSNDLWTFYLNPIDSIDSLDITFGGSVGINQGADDPITQLSYTTTVDIM